MTEQRVMAELDGGRADGHTLEVRDTRYLYVAMIDGEPRPIPEEPDEDLLNRAHGLWECYVRDPAGSGDRVRFFCMRPLDKGHHGDGEPPPPPAEEMRRANRGAGGVRSSTENQHDHGMAT